MFYIFISRGNVCVDQNARVRKLSVILFFIIITKLDIELLSVITNLKRGVRSYFCKRAKLAAKLAPNFVLVYHLLFLKFNVIIVT